MIYILCMYLTVSLNFGVLGIPCLAWPPSQDMIWPYVDEKMANFMILIFLKRRTHGLTKVFHELLADSCQKDTLPLCKKVLLIYSASETPIMNKPLQSFTKPPY